MQEVQGPPTQEQFDLRKYVADMLIDNRQDKQKVVFGSVGKGILGGLFNAAGGIVSGLAGVMSMDDPLGTKGIGDKLFGTPVPDISSIELAKLLMQESGLKDELALKKQELLDRTEQNKAMMKLQTDMQAAEQKHEMAMSKAQMDQRATLLNEQFKHDESMSKLDSSQRLSMATTMAAIELQNTSALTKQQFEDTLKLLEKGNSFTAWEKMKDRAADFIKLAKQHGHEERAQAIQNSFEAGRTTETLAAHTQAAQTAADAQVKVSENEAASRKATTQATVDAATAENTTKQAAADTKDAEKKLDREGRKRILLDTMEKEAPGNALFSHPEIGVRKLITDTDGELNAFGEGLPDKIMQGVEKFMASEGELLIDQYENNPDGLAKALEERVKGPLAAIKTTLHTVATKIPAEGEEKLVDESVYATTDALISKLNSAFQAKAAEVSPRIVNNHAAEANLRQAHAIIQQDEALRPTRMNRLQRDAVQQPLLQIWAKKPSISAPEDEHVKWRQKFTDAASSDPVIQGMLERKPNLRDLFSPYTIGPQLTR